MICTSLHLYLQHKKVPGGAYPQKKHWSSLNSVANVIAALLTYQLLIMLVQVSDPVFRYFIECLSFASPNDVIRPRPLRPSSFVVRHAVKSSPTWQKMWG